MTTTTTAGVSRQGLLERISQLEQELRDAQLLARTAAQLPATGRHARPEAQS
jgi:hypothetical protein